MHQYDSYLNREQIVNTADWLDRDHHVEVTVQLAEDAYDQQNFVIARKLVEEYLQMDPQKDQFYCRAKTLLGLIIHAESTPLSGPSSITKRKEAVNEILAALEVAIAPLNLARYKFLVFNISLAYWMVVRGFLRPGRASHFAISFEKITSALEQQDDADKDWRIMLLSAAALCYDDEKNAKAASDLVDKSIVIMESLLAITQSNEAKLQVHLDGCKTQVDTAMNAFRELEEREELKRKPRKIDPDLPDDDEYYTRPIELPPLHGLAAEGYDVVKTMLDSSQENKAKYDLRMRKVLDKKNKQMENLIRLHRERIAINLGDAKRYMALPNITKDLRCSSLVQLQCILSNVIIDKEWDGAFVAIIKKLEDATPSENRNETLLDVSRAAWALNLVTHALKSMNIVKASTIPISRVLRIKLDICEGMSILNQIDTYALDVASKQVLSRKQLKGLKITKRLEALKIFERTMMMCITALDDKFLVQELCAMMWNATIPLLTKQLRPKVHSILKTMSLALENIQASTLPMLSSMVYYELSLCEEAADYAGLALTEIQKSFAQDFGGLSETQPVDKNLLDLNRQRDQYLTPLLTALNLRVDVYSTPATVDDQAVLWLQQARESTSKPFVREMLTKSSFLVFELMEKDNYGLTPTPPPTEGVIDWALEVMKRGKLFINPVELKALEEELHDDYVKNTAKTTFTFLLQKRVQVLFSIIELSYMIQDVNMLQRACHYLLKFQWDSSQHSYAIEFEVQQIQALCYLAESFALRIQQERTTMLTANKGRRQSASTIVDNASNYALGLHSDAISEIFQQMKVLAVKSLTRAFQISCKQKDIYHTQNVMIFFWNLHLHVFRGNLYQNLLEEVFVFVKVVVTAFDQLLAFPHITENLDVRLFFNYADALSATYVAKNMMVEAAEIASKCCLQVNFPGITSNSVAAAYFKKGLMERASHLSVLNAVAGVAAGGKGGKGAPTGEPLMTPDNPMLNVFSALIIAEQIPSDKIPREVAMEALEKASKLMLHEATAMLKADEEAENNKSKIRTRESCDQRLELQLECFSRLARLRIIHGEYVAAQDCSELGLKYFYSKHQTDSDSLEDEEESGPANTKIFRWISCCEQFMALAIVAFLETSKNGRITSTGDKIAPTSLDPVLVNELQFVALQHLNPSIHYAVKSDDTDLVLRSSKLASSVLQQLLAIEEYHNQAFQLGQKIVGDLTISNRGHECQVLLKSIYLAMITSLVVRKEYDRGLKLIMRAFDKLESELQKDLWPARVICMSRKGMNVLDGLQKLKEKDPLLQAQVLVLFARATKDLPSKFNAYLQAIELLDGRLERVEFLLELAEVMGHLGIPQNEVKVILKNALGTINAVEEFRFEEVADWEDGDNEEEGGTIVQDNGTRKTKSVMTSKTKVSTAKDRNRQSAQSLRGSTTTAKSRVGSVAGRSATGQSERSNAEQANPSLDFKYLEQTMRCYTMLSRLDMKVSDKSNSLLKAFYYCKRAFEGWMDMLRHKVKQEAYQKLSDEEKSSTFYEEFDVEYPAYLHIPSEAMELLQWSTSVELRDATVLLMKDFGDKVPCMKSLPAYNSTIFHLFQLIQSLIEQQYYSYALYAMVFCKQLLWTVPSKANIYEAKTASDRVASLVFLQMLTSKVLLLMGVSNPNTALQQPFVLQSTSQFLTPGDAIADYIAKADLQHLEHDLHKSKLLDLSYQDIMKQVEEIGVGNPQTNPFDILTTAVAFESLTTLDSSYYWLQVVSALIDLNYLPLAERLIHVELWQHRSKLHVHFFVRCNALLVRIQLMKGNYLECIALILRQKPLLQHVGDVLLMKTYFTTLMQCYYHLNLQEESKATASIVLQMLEDLAIRQIERLTPSAAGGGQSTATITMQQKTVMDNVNASRVTLMTANSQGNNNNKGYSQREVIFDNFLAMKELWLEYAHLLVNSLTQQLHTGSVGNPKYDVLEGYRNLCEQINKAMDLIIDEVGEDHDMVLQLQEFRATFALHYLTHFNTSPARITLRIEDYHTWLEDNMMLCMEYWQKLLSSRERSLYLQSNKSLPGGQSLTADQLTHLITTAEEVMKVHNDDLFTKTSTLSKDYHLVVAARKFGLAQYQLASIGAMLNIYRNVHMSTTDFTTILQKRVDLSVIEKYLEETKEIPEKTIDEFDKPFFSLVEDLASSSLCQLEGSVYETSAKILLLFARLSTAISTKHFDYAWLPLPSLTALANVANEEEIAIRTKYAPTADVVSIRNQLCEEVNKHINSENPMLRDANALALLSILESYGCTSAQQAAMYLFRLQSVQSKEWLSTTWMKSLSKTNTLYLALQRVQQYHQLAFPSKEDFQQFHADKTFLSTTSLAYRRLSIEADPSHILPSLESLLPNQLYFCLQFCPFQRVVYLACGKNANAPDPAAKAPAKGQAAPVSIAPEKFWLFDKLNFDESERRSLQVLLEQTRLWQQELAKFIAVYGEHLPEVEETKIDKDGRQQLTTAQKAERAFEERFRAILNDLETLFGKLFGENSRLATFIHEVMQSSPETKFSAMMFMDPNLQILPWESMNVLSGFKGRVGRDFSIHMLHHRSQLATTAPIVSAPSIKHIVDPFGEDNQTDNKPANSEIQERKNLKSFWSGLTKAIPSASKWAPLRDGQGILSAEDFVLGLEQSSAALPASAKNVNLVVHCFGRLGSTLLPSQIATMNLSRIQYLFCADGGHCETSFRRQNSTDVLKAPADLELESNISLCALLSLSGVSAISMTAWSIPINAQHRLLEQFWKNFTNGKKERLNAIVADAFEVEGANPVAVKKWIKGARIHVGVSNFTYTDA